MENRINISELLKDCPKGMELDCTLYDNIVLDCISNWTYPIRVTTKDGSRSLNLTKYGCTSENQNAKCVIFPKGKTTWEGFKRLFKDGDIVVTKTSNNFIFYSIYKCVENREVQAYVDYNLDMNKLMFNDNLSSLCFIDEIVEQRLATEEEKQKLFQAIKDNGYEWNPETKALEKLVTIFKVGDRIKLKNVYAKKYNDFNTRDITEIKDSHYILDGEQAMPLANQYLYELVPNKFDITTLVPFESKVLMRSSNAREWVGTFYSHYSNNKFYGCGMCCDQCIPYEGNEHLIGKTDDCNEYFKIWE